jgi:hypothetical protein
MNKMSIPGTIAALALVLAAPASRPANAQESDHSDQLPLRHLAPGAISEADRDSLEAHKDDLVEAARIYGYNLEAGNWSYQQTLCAPMPETMLLHYFKNYPDGTQSLFTALVPRGAGRVRIVPVHYRNATPYLPAPKNPRNYALFNDLVSPSTSGRDWLELSACYAELTGGYTYVPPAHDDIGIAGAPSATVHVDVRDKSTSVTFAEREGARTYRIWSIAFNRNGRITGAGTEERSVIAANAAQQAEPSTKIQETNLPTETKVQAAQAGTVKAVTQPASESALTLANGPAESVPPSKAQPAPTAPTTARTFPAAPPTAQPAANAAAAAKPTVSASVNESASEPGWKYVLQPVQPPSKLIAPAPPPSEKVTPNPPDPTAQPASANQAH